MDALFVAAGLQDFVDHLEALGIQKAEDVAELFDDDLLNVGLSLVQVRRLQRVAREHRDSDNARSNRSRSPALKRATDAPKHVAFDAGRVGIELGEDGIVAAYAGRASVLTSITPACLLERDNPFVYRLATCSKHPVRRGSGARYVQFEILGGRFNTVGLHCVGCKASLGDQIPIGTAYGWGYFTQTGGIWHNSPSPIEVDGVQPAGPGDTVGLLVNFKPIGSLVVTLFKNGVQMGVPHYTEMCADVCWMALLSGAGSAVRIQKKPLPPVDIVDI